MKDVLREHLLNPFLTIGQLGIKGGISFHATGRFYGSLKPSFLSRFRVEHLWARACPSSAKWPRFLSLYNIMLSQKFTHSLKVQALWPARKIFFARLFSTDGLNDYEKKIYHKLDDSFSPSSLQVQDISGGCGSMFAISIKSDKFSGISMIKQHRMVNEVLKDDIAQWHGLQLKTMASDKK